MMKSTILFTAGGMETLVEGIQENWMNGHVQWVVPNLATNPHIANRTMETYAESEDHSCVHSKGAEGTAG